MEVFLEALEGTPWYVYLIFIYVLYIGIVSLKQRTVKYQTLFILPAILALWSISNLYSRWDGSQNSLFAWMGGFASGVVTGWWILNFYRFRVDRGRGTINLPGNKWTLVLVLSLFGVRYAYGYLYSTMDSIPKHFIISDFAISGLLIGVFIGRAIHYYRIYEKAK